VKEAQRFHDQADLSRADPGAARELAADLLSVDRVDLLGGHGWTPAYVAGQQAALEPLAPRLRSDASAG
jgi:hypothetical protein